MHAALYTVPILFLSLRHHNHFQPVTEEADLEKPPSYMDSVDVTPSAPPPMGGAAYVPPVAPSYVPPVAPSCPFYQSTYPPAGPTYQSTLHLTSCSTGRIGITWLETYFVAHASSG